MTKSENKNTEIDLRIEEISKDAESGAYHLNPDISVTKFLIEGLIKNKKRYGFESCPCRLTMGKKEDNLDIICPCDYRDADLLEYGCCYCALYVSEDVLSGKKKAEPIPDRRTGETGSEINKKSDASKGENMFNLKYPIFRCRVCGYLCARDNPPEKCPICKAGSERFEKYI